MSSLPWSLALQQLAACVPPPLSRNPALGSQRPFAASVALNGPRPDPLACSISRVHAEIGPNPHPTGGARSKIPGRDAHDLASHGAGAHLAQFVGSQNGPGRSHNRQKLGKLWNKYENKYDTQYEQCTKSANTAFRMRAHGAAAVFAPPASRQNGQTKPNWGKVRNKSGNKYETNTRNIRKMYRGENKCEQKYEQKSATESMAKRTPDASTVKWHFASVFLAPAGYSKMALCAQAYGPLVSVHGSEGCGRMQMDILYCECFSHRAMLEHV